MILVTGATGFAGSHLIERLPPGAPITAFTRHAEHVNAMRAGLAWRTVDLLDRASVSNAIRDTRPAAIYHLAGSPHVGASFADPVPPLEIHAVGTHRLLDAVAEHAPDARVVVVTSAMIYAPSNEPHTEASPAIPSSPYALSKLAQDRLAALAAEDGLDVVIARPFNHTGPRQDPSFSIPGFAEQIALIERGRHEPVLRVGNLDAERDIIDVRDVVDAYQVLAERGERGVAYNVCGGHAWRIGDLLDRLLRLARTRIRVELDPERLRPAEIPHLAGNNARLRALGWQPRIGVDEMLVSVLEFWRSRAA